MFFEYNFVDLGHYLVQRVKRVSYVLPDLLNCLHNFQIDILSNKEAILQTCSLKELKSEFATMLRMCCYRCVSRSLAKIYRTDILSNFL